ncbi:hypothetical protein D3C72_1522480 [compost metagenome]
MAVFSSTPFAVDCAIDIQREFHRYNSDSGEPIYIRIGLDCEEPIEESNDFFVTIVQLATWLRRLSEYHLATLLVFLIRFAREQSYSHSLFKIA